MTSKLTNRVVSLGMAVTMAAGWMVASPAGAQDVTTVRISGSTNPSIVEGPDEPCSDVIRGEFTDGTVTFSRDDPTLALTVEFSVTGSAVEGTDYTVTPDDGQLTFPAGKPDAEVRVSPSGGAFDGTLPSGGAVDGRTVVVSIVDGPDYAVGTPGSATLTIERSVVNVECGPPTFTSAPVNTRQDIAVGDGMAALEVEPFPGTEPHVVLDDGALPPGITLDWDGTFAGTASGPGTYMATVTACTPTLLPPEQRTLCDSTELSILVGQLGETPRPQSTGPQPLRTLPRTGPPAPGLTAVALVALVAGWALTRASRRRPGTGSRGLPKSRV